ncbi:WD40 repeat-like protein, partial [Metschnikowia bicuspidata var. bicuspidata NRRL YB-4993]
MLSATIAIHWHDDGHPVYSLDIQPSNQLDSRLATAGGDKNVRIWRIRYSETGDPQDTSVEYLSTLRKHTQAVNVVRFDRSGKLLASGGDDGMLIIWTLSKTIVHDFGVQDDEMKESWIVHQIHNSNLEIYDISWSPDSKSIATGSMDNTTKIFNVLTGQKEMEISDHSHYVQGIAWDPLNKFFATQSADRSVNIYTIAMNKGSSNSQLSTSLLSKLMKAETPLFKVQLATKLNYLYHSENLQSFFRRLAFSPDGSLLLVPLGIYKYENCRDDTLDGSIETGLLNTVYIYTRTGLNQSPVCHLPGLSKPAIAVAFCPTMFELSGDENPPVFALPYKMVFAVATHDAVIIYDTERLRPLGILSNLHYLSITDLCWNADGQSLMISSAEGFCSVITFD